MRGEFGRDGSLGGRIVTAVLAGLLARTAHARFFAGTLRRDPIHPIPAATGLEPRKVALGARLFADPRLSRDDSLGCASCHDLERGGADGLPGSVGVGGFETEMGRRTTFFIRLPLANGATEGSSATA